MKRKQIPKEYQIFNNKEWVKNYDRQSGIMMRIHAKGYSRIIKKKWNLKKGKVLDIGTGPGNLAIQLATCFPDFEVIGLDASEEALEVAREKTSKIEKPLKLTFIKGDAEKLPFDNQSFDLVVSSFTLHILSYPLKMFNEIQRVLKPEGKFLISDFRRGIFGSLMQPIQASYTKKEVIQLLEESELKNWDVHIEFYPPMSFIIIHSKEV